MYSPVPTYSEASSRSLPILLPVVKEKAEVLRTDETIAVIAGSRRQRQIRRFPTAYKMERSQSTAQKALVSSQEDSVPMGTDIHLWGSKAIESAVPIASNCGRCSGRNATAPAHAASTCNHRLCRVQMAETEATGSIVPHAVDPTVATTINGARPRARS